MEKELGFKDMAVRFFVWDAEPDQGEPDIIEVCEADFVEADGVITYERHTTYENGCEQICLTKTPE